MQIIDVFKVPPDNSFLVKIDQIYQTPDTIVSFMSSQMYSSTNYRRHTPPICNLKLTAINLVQLQSTQHQQLNPENFKFQQF